MNKTIKLRQKKEKEVLLEHLRKTPIIQVVCERAGIGRATYYRWRKKDLKFATQADEALEMSVALMNDVAESQLLSAIRDGNMTGIIFWLKSRHKGYSTKISLTGSLDTTIKLDAQQKKLFKKAEYNKHKNVVLSKYSESQINTLPIKTTTIVDYGGKKREIFVYCIYERWLQMYLKLQIEYSIEKRLKRYVFGYRKGLSMEDLHSYLLDTGLEYILHLDIAKYFDQVDRKLLFDYLKHLIGVGEDILVKIQKSVSHTDKGLPQGNVLSPLLSNVYLMPFDECFPENYARFSDDLYFALDAPQKKDATVKKVSAHLLKYNLKLNYSKLEIKNVSHL